MGRSARNTKTTASLLKEAQRGQTGRLVVGAGAHALEVYLLHGQIVAAHAADDLSHLVRLSRLRGGITTSVAAELEEGLARDEDVFGALLDRVPSPLLDPILSERFRQNLAAFLGASGKPTFEPLRAVFVDHLHLGRETEALVDGAIRLWDEASALDPDATVVRGDARPATKDQRIVASKVTQTPVTLSSLLAQVPLEALAARVVLLEMLQSGALRVPGGGVEDDLADEPTVHGRENSDPPPAAPPQEPELELELDPEDLTETVHTAPRREDVETPAGLTSLSAWLESTTHVSDDDLDFFSDHDFERGAGDAGSFSTDSHNLDRVEVAASDEQEIEAEEAPTPRFSAPKLSQTEALEKIAVANDVLSLVVRAFDDTGGSGRGRAVVQLLVDGSPARFATLLAEVQVDDHGRLPDERLLGNLYGRPPSEHRQLMNQALVDIIERALSSAADDLSDDQFDHVLESAAGYRQRLGL